MRPDKVSQASMLAADLKWVPSVAESSWEQLLPVPDIVQVQELQRLKKLPHDDADFICAHLTPVLGTTGSSGHS